MFADLLYGSTDCHFLPQLQDCGEMIKVGSGYVRLCCNLIAATMRRRNIAQLFGKNICS